MEHTSSDPHRGQPLLTYGPRPSDARATVIMIHGRGATADSILALADELRLDDLAYVAPQAAGDTWYPYSFLSPSPATSPESRPAWASSPR